MSQLLKNAIRGTIIWVGILSCAPLVAFAVMLRPFILIRFGTLRSDRIGHFAADTEAYVLSREGAAKRRVVDIIGCPEPVCNRQLEAMWRRTFPIAPGDHIWRWEIFEAACRFWTRSSVHSVKLYDRSPDYRMFSITPPSLTFTEEEERRGRQALDDLGIPPNAEWVCIHNRDSAYLEAVGGGPFPHHDYRDYDIESMRAAADKLTHSGYFVIRMGAVVQAPLSGSNPRIIDYARTKKRNDFLDIYLLSRAKFFLGNDSGIWCVPLIFRRPLAMTNFVLLRNFYEKDYEPWLFIPKRMRNRKTGQYLTLRETLVAGLGDADKTEVFAASGADLVNNTSDEILDLAVELDDRVNNRWNTNETDENLQRRFWDIFREHAKERWIRNRRARIGAGFLRRHPEYLT